MYEVYVAILFCFILENALFWHTSVSMDGYAELTCTVLLRVGVSVFQSPSSALHSLVNCRFHEQKQNMVTVVSQFKVFEFEQSAS